MLRRYFIIDKFLNRVYGFSLNVEHMKSIDFAGSNSEFEFAVKFAISTYKATSRLLP